MGLRTQNPVMQRCFVKLAKTGSVFTFGDSNIPDNIKDIARVLAERIHDSHLDANTLLSPDVYGSSLYGKSYELNKKSIGTSFSKLNQDAGDAAYCIWQR